MWKEKSIIVSKISNIFEAIIYLSYFSNKIGAIDKKNFDKETLTKGKKKNEVIH